MSSSLTLEEVVRFLISDSLSTRREARIIFYEDTIRKYDWDDFDYCEYPYSVKKFENLSELYEFISRSREANENYDRRYANYSVEHRERISSYKEILICDLVERWENITITPYEIIISVDLYDSKIPLADLLGGMRAQAPGG